MDAKTKEHLRISEKRNDPVPPWLKWGPYVAERSWATVREDYSWNGDAWSYFPFEESDKKAYRWGEDGIAGWCDRYQVLVFSTAFWNGKDPILKERHFGLSSPQGNHAEDVKECYYYLDGTPTHSYMKYLYKYPQSEFPYSLLKETNARLSSRDLEYELVDTGVFKDNRYFDIYIEYAKASPEDLCIRIEAFNRGNESAPLHILPQLWFRNQWAWWDIKLPEPQITNESKNQSEPCLLADDSKLLSPQNLSFDYHLGKRYLYGTLGGKPLFTNNESPSADQRYYKNGFHRAIINKEEAVNPAENGTKACLHYFFETVPAHSSAVVHLRLTSQPMVDALKDVDQVIAQRKEEADAFYETIHPPLASPEERMIQRQAIAGMLWNKQFYMFDVNQWIEGDNSYSPLPPSRVNIRNTHWRHLNSMRILSMPDKWEYPWFAAWDLAFHCLTFGLVDIEFAKEQLWLLLFDQFQHPNGAIPAYEWDFSDLNPPVQAWAVLRLYEMQKKQTGIEDRNFLKKCYLKLIVNFAYWVNKVDSSGCNVFEGGFLGLDNIALIDRSMRLAENAVLKQSDGTGWMALFSLSLMRMSLELAKEDATYEAMATKFFEHFVYVAHAMKKMGNKHYTMWSEADGFFHDVLVFPDGNFSQFAVRSLVGLIPLYAVEVLSEQELNSFPQFKRDFLWFLKNRKALTKECAISITEKNKTQFVLTLVDKDHLKRVLQYVWDPNEFRSEYGIRSLSKVHEKNPFVYKDLQVGYEPGESVFRVKGGNSNWRGPIWFPTSYLFIQSLKKFSDAFGQEFQIKVGTENPATLEEMAHSFAERLISLFTLDSSGRRPFFGQDFPFAKDPYFQDNLLFYEYFHGDTGRGLGASHQTGWSGLVANLIDECRKHKKSESRNN
jgi:hypothetical protein